MSKMLKMKYQISLAVEQCNRRWEIDSPFSLHMQHQSSTITWRLLKLSMVRMWPKAAAHTKNATRRSFGFPHTLPRKRPSKKTLIRAPNLEHIEWNLTPKKLPHSESTNGPLQKFPCFKLYKIGQDKHPWGDQSHTKYQSKTWSWNHHPLQSSNDEQKTPILFWYASTD